MKFQDFFLKKKFDLTWNGQVCMLEELLNQEFDANQTRIYITDSVYNDPTYIYLNLEQNEETYVFLNASNVNDPLYEDLYLYNNNESSSYFIVHVPISLNFDIDLFNYLINKYKLLTTKYKIVYE